MKEEKTQIADGVASVLNAELDSLLEIASDYLSSQKEGRFAPLLGKTWCFSFYTIVFERLFIKTTP